MLILSYEVAGSVETLTMLVFIMGSVLLTNIQPLSATETDDILNVEEASQELRDQFDQLPLLSKNVTNSDWCEVWQ